MKEILFENILSCVGGFIFGVLGTIIGGVVSFLFFRHKEEVRFNTKLYTEYQPLAQELATILQDFLVLSLHPGHYTKDVCQKIDNDLSKFFFKYYLVLPQSVLEEINCLHACLRSQGKYLYVIDKTKDVPTVRECVDTNEVISFINDVTIVSIRKSWAELYRQYQKLPDYLKLRFQARHVISKMQVVWQYKDMKAWQKEMRKKTLAMYTK